MTAREGARESTPSVSILEYDGEERHGDAADGMESPLVLVDPGVGDLLILTAAELHRHPPAAAERIPEIAAGEARAMRRRRISARRRRRFSSGFVTFAERLNRAVVEDEACDVVTESAADLLDAHAAILYLRPDGSADELSPTPGHYLDMPLLPLAAAALLHSETGPVTLADTRTRTPVAALQVLFRAGARYLACAPVSDRALLVVSERRADRPFGGEDWFRLQSVARQTGRTLERLADARHVGRAVL